MIFKSASIKIMDQLKSLRTFFFMIKQKTCEQQKQLYSSADIFTFALTGKTIIFHNLNTVKEATFSFL